MDEYLSDNESLVQHVQRHSHRLSFHTERELANLPLSAGSQQLLELTKVLTGGKQYFGKPVVTTAGVSTAILVLSSRRRSSMKKDMLFCRSVGYSFMLFTVTS